MTNTKGRHASAGNIYLGYSISTANDSFRADDIFARNKPAYCKLLAAAL
jgi:hypothetical protein